MLVSTHWNSSWGCSSLCLQRSVVGDCSNFAQEDKEAGSISVSPAVPDLSHFLCSQDLQPSCMRAPSASPPLPKGSLQSSRKDCHINTQGKKKRKQGGYLEVKDGYSLPLSPASALSEQGNPPPASLFTSALNVAMLCFVCLTCCNACRVPFSPLPPSAL